MTEKNIYVVRHAIDNYIKSNPENLLNEHRLNSLNDPQKIADLNRVIDSFSQKLSPDSEDFKLLAILRGALNLKSVEIPKPKQNPVPVEIAGNLMGEDVDIPVVSIGQQPKGPDLSKILPKKISFTEEAEKPIVDALSAFGEWNNSLTDDCRDYISLLFSDTEKNENGTIKSLDEGIINKFVKSVLDANDTDKIELNAKNVLLVRYNIITYFEQSEGQYKDIYNDLNSPEGRKPYVDYLQNALKTETDPDTVTGIRIFIAALTETDLSKLDANPIPPHDIKA